MERDFGTAAWSEAVEAAAPPAVARPAPPARKAVRCRPIVPDDSEALCALLARGFEGRSASDWAQALAKVRQRTEADGLPGLGYVLDDGGALVGVLLTLYAPGAERCNISSWYVEEGYRRFGTMLVSAAIRDRSVTYVNVSSVRHTRPIIEAQGFRRYADGVMAALPLLAFWPRERVVVSRAAPGREIAVEPGDRLLMERHAAMGCLTFWCVAAGRAHPFVFARRIVAGRLPVAQVVYCPDGTDWRRFAAPLGRALLRHGLFVLFLDAPEKVPGLPGRFLPGRMPKYARGPATPRCGDLADTEVALFGA